MLKEYEWQGGTWQFDSDRAPEGAKEIKRAKTTDAEKVNAEAEAAAKAEAEAKAKEAANKSKTAANKSRAAGTKAE